MIYAAKHNTVKVKTAGACGTPVAEHPVPSLRISSEHPERTAHILQFSLTHS